MLRSPRTSTPKTRQGDKFEISPNSRAKCVKCRKQITKGEKRVGKEVYAERYFGYIHRYYHEKCFPEALKRRLQLQAASPEDELMRAVKEKKKQELLVSKRRDLYEALRTLRRDFASALHVEDRLYMVFANKTLEEMTIQMPTNKRDMLFVYGMGPKKYQSFGEAFLQLIQHYARKYARAKNVSTSASAAASSSSAEQVATAAQADDAVPLETLSCTEIVQRKFEHAAANGYVISVEE
jgi:superfamily II DNA helicase RecQ